MRMMWIGIGAALLLLGAGCPKPASWEIAEEAFSPENDLTRAEVARELQRARKRADEEIAENPEASRPYETKAQLLWIHGDFAASIETYREALDRSKPETEADREALKFSLLVAYLRSGQPDLIKKGIRYVQERMQEEGPNNLYAYFMGLYNRKLYKMLGDGVYKSDANHWFLKARLDPDMVRELKREGLYDPLLEE